MSRSAKKGYYLDHNLEDKIEDAIKTGNRKPIKTWSRRSTITPDAIGLVFLVHKGNGFEEVHVTENMVGHKFGEFAETRKFKGHQAKK